LGLTSDITSWLELGRTQKDLHEIRDGCFSATAITRSDCSRQGPDLFDGVSTLPRIHIAPGFDLSETSDQSPKGSVFLVDLHFADSLPASLPAQMPTDARLPEGA
jgi:hypothetical protein